MQAIIYKITPFDAENGTVIKFSWSGNQVFKNRCVIRNNETNEIIYDNTIETFKLEHEIDLTKAALVNGVKYDAYITVFDSNGTESDMQPIGTSFLCLKTPVFTFSNVSEGQVISSSSYECSLYYEQADGELLDSWSISVYDKSDTLQATSGVKYDTASLSYLFSGFNNKTEYRVRAVGQTVNGILLDTGYVNISVTYLIKDVFSLLEPTNICKLGAIQIRSNIVSADGELKEEGVYINNEYLDLRNNELTYGEGFVFKDSYSFAILFYDAKPNQTVAEFYADDSSQFKGTITYRIGKFGIDTMKACYELRITSNGITSIFYSNKISIPDDTDLIGICVSHAGQLYSIEITNRTKGE